MANMGQRVIPHWKMGLVLAVPALFVGFSFQGSRGLYETTEGRYAECAREMLETGNWLDPQLNYKPHWTKPPLTYWAIGAGMKLFGNNEWGVRFYTALSFVISVLVVAFLGETLWDRETGWVAGLMYCSSIFPVLAANSVNTDTLLTLWELAAVLCYWKAYRAAAPAARGWVCGMWIFFGLGFLTKGPPSLLPLVPILVFQALQRRTEQAPPKLLNPIGLAAFVVIGFSWYLRESFYHTGLLSYWLKSEVVARVATNKFHRNPEWYWPLQGYLPVLTIGAGPWLYFGLKAIRSRSLYKPSKLLALLRENERALFLFLWLLIPLSVFCVSKSRLHLYVLPIYAPVALAIARSFVAQQFLSKGFRTVLTITTCMIIALVAVKGFVAHYSLSRDMRAVYELCSAETGPKPVCFVFNEGRMYGLQFYLDGTLKRVSLTGKQHWADMSVHKAIRMARDKLSDKTVVFLADKRDAGQLRGVLKKKWSSLKISKYDDWVAFKKAR